MFLELSPWLKRNVPFLFPSMLTDYPNNRPKKCLSVIPCSLIHVPLGASLIFLKLSSLLILKHFEKSPLTPGSPRIKFQTILSLSYPCSLKSEPFLIYSFHVSYVTFTIKMNCRPQHMFTSLSLDFRFRAELLHFPFCTLQSWSWSHTWGLIAFPLKHGLSTTQKPHSQKSRFLPFLMPLYFLSSTLYPVIRILRYSSYVLSFIITIANMNIYWTLVTGLSFFRVI